MHPDAERCTGILGFGPGSSSADIPVAMAVKALTLDPDDRDGYLLLGKLPRRSKEDRKKVEGAFLGMMAVFPEDPFLCLELASVYYESQAFRKAENERTQITLMDPRAPHATIESGGAQLALFDDVFDFGAFLDRELSMTSLVDRLSRHAAGPLRQALAHFCFGPEPGAHPFLPFENPPARNVPRGGNPC